MDSKNFSRNLIKGGIAETVFERMFTVSGNYLVIPFGYEKTVNILTQINKDKEAFEVVRSMPDYVLVDKNSEETYIVEVKYRSNKDYSNIKNEAEKIKKKGWKKVWFFLATPYNFYFCRCSNLIEDPRSIDDHELSESMVNKDLQDEYLLILNEFEK